MGQVKYNTVDILPSGGAVGQVCFYETAANGSNKVCLSAAASLAGDATFKLPTADGSAGQALTTDGSGQLSWSSVGTPPFSDANPILKDNLDATKELLFSIGGFTTATQRTVTVPDADFTLAGVGLNNGFSVDQDFLSGRINIGASGATGPGLRDNAGVLECTDDGSTWAACGPAGLTNYWARTGTTITTATPNDDLKLDRHLLFTSPSVSDIGSSTNYAQTLYVENIDASPAGITGNYVSVRKLEIDDQFGGTSFWDFQVQRSGSTVSLYYVRDNAGTVVHRMVQKELSIDINEAQFLMSLVPGNGTTNADNTYDVGTPTRSWRNGQFDGTLTTNNLTVTGTCTGCASLPFSDASAIIKGSVDATKLLRFEVDGFTTATTRVMTPPNADATLAGINLAQTWTATQTFQHIQFPSASTYDIGTSANYGQTLYIENVDAAPAGIVGNYAKVRKFEITDETGGTSFWDFQVKRNAADSLYYVRDNAGTVVHRLVQNEFTVPINQGQFLLHLVPGNGSTNADNTYDLGSAARSWRTAYLDTSIVIGGSTFVDASRNTTVNNLTVAGACTGCGGLPVVDTTALVFGSGDATKRVRMEVDGVTSGVTRVLTVPNADITIAGINIAQTWTATQSFGGGSYYFDISGNVNAASYLIGGVTIFNSSRYWNTGSGSFEPSSSAAASLGSPSRLWSELYMFGAITQNGTSRLSSGGVFNGASFNVAGTEVISSGRVFKPVSLDVNGTANVIDSGRNANVVSITVNGAYGITSGGAGSFGAVTLTTIAQGFSTRLDSSGNASFANITTSGNLTWSGQTRGPYTADTGLSFASSAGKIAYYDTAGNFKGWIPVLP